MSILWVSKDSQRTTANGKLGYAVVNLTKTTS